MWSWLSARTKPLLKVQQISMLTSVDSSANRYTEIFAIAVNSAHYTENGICLFILTYFPKKPNFKAVVGNLPNLHNPLTFHSYDCAWLPYLVRCCSWHPEPKCWLLAKNRRITRIFEKTKVTGLVWVKQNLVVSQGWGVSECKSGRIVGWLRREKAVEREWWRLIP